MGWKSVKDHYQISHIVRTSEGEGICIGSPYVYDLMVITEEGVLTKKNYGGNADLARYQSEMEENPELLKELVLKDDVFETSIPVYTYNGGEIIEAHCEKIGWPNVTHDGQLMYENTFSQDKDKVIAWAFENAEAGIRIHAEQVEEAKAKLKEREDYLAQANSDLEKLKIAHPEYKGRKEND